MEKDKEVVQKTDAKTDVKPSIKAAADDAVSIGGGEFRSRLEKAASHLQREVKNIDRQRKHLEATVVRSLPIDRELEAMKEAINDIYQLASQLPSKK